MDCEKYDEVKQNIITSAPSSSASFTFGLCHLHFSFPHTFQLPLDSGDGQSTGRSPSAFSPAGGGTPRAWVWKVESGIPPLGVVAFSPDSEELLKLLKQGMVRSYSDIKNG